MQKTEEPKPALSPGEVDLMFWQYCVGVVQTANQCTNKNNIIEPELLNALAETRHFHLETSFLRAPSYSVVFERLPGSGFGIKKISK